MINFVSSTTSAKRVDEAAIFHTFVFMYMSMYLPVCILCEIFPPIAKTYSYARPIALHRRNDC